MRFLLTMILLTICVSCRSVLKIECKKTEDGKDYDEILPALLEINGEFRYDAKWNEMQGQDMPNDPYLPTVIWKTSEFCKHAQIRSNFNLIFKFFGENIIPMFRMNINLGEEVICFFDLEYEDLRWSEKDFYVKNFVGLQSCFHYFPFAFNHKEELIERRDIHLVPTKLFEKSSGKNSICVKIPGSTADKFVLI